jgi:hypothetical protein
LKKSKIPISIIWCIFALLFLLLGLYHWDISKENIPPFKITGRPLSNIGSAKILGIDVDKPLNDFARDFNMYLDEQNVASRKQNKLSAYGYWLACLTAILSLILEWIDGLKPSKG